MNFRKFYYPKWFKYIYPNSVWGFSFPEKVVYLTFDDGPTENSTIWILNQLKAYEAQATFFCLGKNAEMSPSLIHDMRNHGHVVANHTMHHLNGFKQDVITYVNDVKEAEKYFETQLFRPPYGKITFKQHKALRKEGFKIVFWSFLTYDFDATISAEKVVKKIKKKIKSGDILVFHDSVKALPKLKEILPETLAYLHEQGYVFKAIQK